MGKSTYAGEAIIADVLDLQFRLPRLWARVQSCEVLASYARFVARQTRDLSVEQAAYVDARIAEPADGRVTWSRFTDLVAAAIKAADPAAAEAREKEARKPFARPTHSTEDGMRGFYLWTDAVSVTRLDATVAYIAEALAALGSTEPLDTRRAMAMVVLANPAEATRLLAEYATWNQRPADPPRPSSETDADADAPHGPHEDPDRDGPDGPVGDAIVMFRKGGGETHGDQPVLDWHKLLPTVNLFVHLYGGELTGGGLDRSERTDLARIEAIGAVTEAWIRDVLGPGARFVVRPVLDLLDQAPVDSYEIPDRHRQAVRLMTPADVFPFGSATVNRIDGWPSMQIDHTIPYDHARELGKDAGEGSGASQSRIGNYGPLTGQHHNLKTHGGWQCQQPYPGIFLWRDRYGATYLVDNTGTRRIRGTTTPIHLDLVEYQPAA